MKSLVSHEGTHTHVRDGERVSCESVGCTTPSSTGALDDLITFDKLRAKIPASDVSDFELSIIIAKVRKELRAAPSAIAAPNFAALLRERHDFPDYPSPGEGMVSTPEDWEAQEAWRTKSADLSTRIESALELAAPISRDRAQYECSDGQKCKSLDRTACDEGCVRRADGTAKPYDPSIEAGM